VHCAERPVRQHLRIVHDVPHIAFLADLYHLARMGEPIEQLIQRRADRFGHVQIADPPGRGQPGTGDLDWGTLLDLLAASGYRGHVGLEYKLAGRAPTASAGSSGTCVPMRPSKSPSGISCWVAVRHSIVGHGCGGRQRRGFLTTGSTTSTIEIVGLRIMGSAIAANVLKGRPHRRRPSRS
jgi:hypothetical protein